MHINANTYIFAEQQLLMKDTINWKRTAKDIVWKVLEEGKEKKSNDVIILQSQKKYPNNDM